MVSLHKLRLEVSHVPSKNDLCVKGLDEQINVIPMRTRGHRGMNDTILCRLGSMMLFCGQKRSTFAARKEASKSKDETKILIINDVDACGHCLPAMKCYCSKHADSLVLFAWLYRANVCNDRLHLMFFNCRPSCPCNPSPPQDHIHALFKPLTRPSSPSCSSSARPSS